MKLTGPTAGWAMKGDEKSRSTREPEYTRCWVRVEREVRPAIALKPTRTRGAWRVELEEVRAKAPTIEPKGKTPGVGAGPNRKANCRRPAEHPQRDHGRNRAGVSTNAIL